MTQATGSASAPATEELEFTPRRPSALFREWRWLLSVALLTMAFAASAALFDRRFFFVDDTQAGAWPVWVKIGEELKQGHFVFLEPSHWSSGNALMEGQWGTYSPLMWVIALFTSSLNNGNLAVAIVKVAFVGIAATGIYAITRSYGAAPRWAFVAGLVAPFIGFSAYMDDPAWVTGLFIWALLPWAWWGMRSTGVAKANVLWAFVPGYALVAVGYVHGVLMLIAMIVGVIIELALIRDWRGVVRTVASGALLGLVTLTVFLPGLLSASVTRRASESFANSNFLSPDPSALIYSILPIQTPWLTGFWTVPAPSPLLYFSWFLLLAVVIDFRKVRGHLRIFAAPLTILFVASFIVFGPSEIGPLRFPARLLPFVGLMLIIMTAVAVSRWRAPLTRGRLLFGGGWLVVALFLTFSDDPKYFFAFALGAVLVGAGALAVLWADSWSKNAAIGVALAATLLTLGLNTGQHLGFKRPAGVDYGSSELLNSYRDTLSNAKGDTIVVGVGYMQGKDAPTHFANGWWLTDATVVNTYSPILHAKFGAALCQEDHGWLCAEGAVRLFETDPTTGLPLVDLMGISTIQVLNTGAPADGTATASNYPYAAMPVPAGWTEVQRTPEYALWERDTPVKGAGNIVWSSPGVTYSHVKESKTQISFDVDSTSPDGKVTFSRLNWPGYSASNASFADPVRGFLLTVDVSHSKGKRVVVTFRPPGWHLEIASLAVALTAALGWAITEPIVRARRRSAA